MLIICPHALCAGSHIEHAPKSDTIQAHCGADIGITRPVE
jgi:hypothetical protein